VRKERAPKSQVCSSHGQERYLARDGWIFIAHTLKTSCWEILCTSRSDRSAIGSQDVKFVMATFKFEI
jgi:hypothetical protein